MRVSPSTSAGRFHGNTKRPPERRWRAPEGLTKRRRILLMAVTHTMYLCPRTGGNLLQKEQTDG